MKKKYKLLIWLLGTLLMLILVFKSTYCIGDYCFYAKMPIEYTGFLLFITLFGSLGFFLDIYHDKEMALWKRKLD